MPVLENDTNGYLKPPIGLEVKELEANDKNNETTRFEWNDAVGNKVKKDVVVFKHGAVEEFLKWKESIEDVLKEQNITNIINTIAAFNRVLANPAKNHYNNAINQAKQEEDRRVATMIANGNAAVTNY